MTYKDEKREPEPPRPPENLTCSTGAAVNEARSPKEVHPREIIMREISQRCELLIDQIAMLREFRAQVQFMGRDEAQLLLKALRSAECTGLLRW